MRPPSRPRGGIQRSRRRSIASWRAAWPRIPRTALIPAMSWPLRYIRSRARAPNRRLQQSKTTLVVATNAPTRRRAHGGSLPVAGVELQVIRSFRAGLVVPPPPEAVRFAAAVPLDAMIHTTQTVMEAPPSGIADGASPAVDGKESSAKSSRSAKPSSSRQKRSLNLRSSPSKALSAALPSLPTVKEPAASAVASSGLQIEVTSAVAEGTLTVFADRELLFSIDLASEKKGQPLHFENSLPAGPHHSE